MKIVNLIQNTPEWHKYRNTRIGASDLALFACHKGLSKPIFTINLNSSIYNKRNNIQILPTYNMTKGINSEDGLLNKFNARYNTNCMSTVIECNDYIYSSLDGFCPMSGTIVEIKTTSATLDKFDDKMQYYIFQLCHQLYCSELDSIWVSMEFQDGSIKDKQYTLDDMPITKDEWLSLCEEYMSLLNPNEEDEKTIDLLDDYQAVLEHINQLTIIKEQILDKIKSRTNGGVYGDYTVSNTIHTTTQYAAFIKDNKIGVPDKYTKAIEQFRITKKDK